MRKIVLLSLALAAALAASVSTPNPAEAAVCTYRCICSVAYKCCGTACKPDPSSPLQCPQVAC